MLVNSTRDGVVFAMSLNCGHCGQPLKAGAASCARCGKSAETLGMQYGMVDLGAGDDLPELPSLDTVEQRHAIPAARTKGVTQRKAASGPVARPGAATGRTGAGTDAGRSGVSSKATARSTGSQSREQKGAARQTGADSASSRTGSGARSNVARSGAAVRSGQAARTASAQAMAAVDPGASYGRGAMMDEDPFNQAFGAGGSNAALELEHERERVSPEPEETTDAEPVPVVEETPVEVRERRIGEIAAYGAAPARVTGYPLYCVRVLLRKRVVAEELAALSIQRRRADDAASEALAKLGEALYSQRQDPDLAPLAKLFAAVSAAEHQVGHVEAQGQKRKSETDQELERLDQMLETLDRKAAPLRQRETEIDADLTQRKAEVRRADMLLRKAEAELEALLRSKAAADGERVAAMHAERDARHGELQTLGIELRPVEDELGTVRRQLAQLLRTAASLQEEKQMTVVAHDRATQNHRVSSGSARGARAQALVSLATAALKQGFQELAPEQTQGVDESTERAERKRQQEELHRAALNSYDHKAYSQGLTALLGAGILFFLSLALKILL
jgi:hypothetical protein